MKRGVFRAVALRSPRKAIVLGVVGLVCLACSAIGFGQPMADSGTSLLSTHDDSSTSTNPGEWAGVALNLSELNRLNSAGAGSTSIRLWDSALSARFTSVETSAGYTRGMGRLQSPAEGTLSFVWDGSLFSGVLHDLAIGTIEIATDSNGNVRARKVNLADADYPRCAENVRMPDSAAPHGGPDCPPPLTVLNNYGADDGSMVDIMFVYTAAARDAAGGVAQIESRIELAITDANNAYQNSTINPRIRSIRKALIDYTETGVGITDLTRLSTPGDGFLESVHADRDTYGADLVHMWVSTLNVGGVAWSMAGLPVDVYDTSGFCVMRQDNYVFHTLAHEAGHNFGCDHDRANTAGGALFNYSFGYREPGNLWHDIMAYDPGQVIPYFSNPDLNYNGPPGNPGPMGVPLNQPLPCHNVLTHNNTAWNVANYRPATLTSVPPSRLYVNAAAAPGGSGVSWATAIKDLQTGMGKAAAARGAISEVWVAAGTYKPDQGSNDRTRSFRPVQGVAIYGGFAGSETLLSQRNIATNVTILSGDIGISNDASDNTYHVIVPTYLNATAILDGFTITGGNANGAFPHDTGGGLRGECNTAMFANCTFTANHATFSAGAALNFNGGSPTFTNCSFSTNTVTGDSAGAVRNDNSNPVFTGCTFSNNSAPYFGAVVNMNGSGAIFTNCNFTGNTATDGDGSGGALRNDNCGPTYTGCTFSANVAPNAAATEDVGSTAVYTNCTFQNHTSAAWYGASGVFDSALLFIGCTFTSNSCTEGGGAIALFDSGDSEIWTSHFNTNTAGFGGGIYCVDTSLPINNSTFNGNTASPGGGIYIIGGAPTVSGCSFTQNHADNGDAGGAMAITGSALPNITNCQFTQNDADYTGGAIQNWGSTPVVTGCTFVGNTADYGGAVNCDDPGAALFNRSLFVGNVAQFSGGAMQHSFGANSTTVNCVFSGNLTPLGEGAAIHSYGGAAPSIVNCSLSRNTADSFAGGIYAYESTVVVTNCLLWENSGPSGMNQAAQINGFNSTLTVNYTSLQGSTGSLGGVGNNGSNPQFVDADGVDNTLGTVDDNLALQAASSAIDAANKAAVPAGITTDIAGNPRCINACAVADTGAGTPPLPDRGAYEFVPGGVIPGDTNASGSVSTADIASFVAVLLGTDTNPAHVAAADLNCDALANGRDVRGFAQLLTGP